MTRRPSLRARLYAVALGVIAVAMAASWVGLTALFERHLERRVGQELQAHLQQLAGAVEISADGALSLLRQPADPRFTRIAGGLYWQVSDMAPGGGTLASRSLWDERLALPDGRPEPGGVHVHDIVGPGATSLLALERVIVLSAPAGDERRVAIAAAIDRAEIAQLRAGFGRDLAPALLLLGAVLFAGFAVQVEAGLRPLAPLRKAIAGVKDGSTARLAVAVPAEIGPLADEINALLSQREAELARARDRAADLAHGLKTPLAALGSDIDRLRMKGESAIAGQIEEVAESMRRHVERELVRARLRHGPVPLVLVLPAAEAVARTLARTPAGDGKSFDLAIAPDLALRMDADDLNEVLGNLMENAARHAARTIRVEAVEAGGEVLLRIDDDGPGMDEASVQSALARGCRLDVRGGGSGLGLAIVGDIAVANGAELRLTRAGAGGLRAEFRLPPPGRPA